MMNTKFLVLFIFCCVSNISHADPIEIPETTTTIEPPIQSTNDLPTFEALVDWMKPEENEPVQETGLSKDARRVEKLTSFFANFKLNVDKVNYQARRFKETIQNKGQNYQDMKQLLKDIYHKVMQDTLDKYGFHS